MNDIDLNKSTMLPVSTDSMAGATASSLGDASMVDLKKGFFNATATGSESTSLYEAMEKEGGGFAGRPCGYER